METAVEPGSSAVVGREQLGSPEVTTFHFCETTVFLREATPSWNIEGTQRGQDCLSCAIEQQKEQLVSEIIPLSQLLVKQKLVRRQIA